jgi:hypothetical protein
MIRNVYRKIFTVRFSGFRGIGDKPLTDENFCPGGYGEVGYRNGRLRVTGNLDR